MGWGVYKAPDGTYAIWSSIPTDFVLYDCSRSEVVDAWDEKYGKGERGVVLRQLEYADGLKPRPRIGDEPETFASRLEQRDAQHGTKIDKSVPRKYRPSKHYIKWLAKMRAMLEANR